VKITLKPEPLTAAAFAPYGDVIECAQVKEERHINYGYATRYHDLACVDINADGGKSLVSIFCSKPVERPIQVKMMERHPLSHRHQPILCPHSRCNDE